MIALIEFCRHTPDPFDPDFLKIQRYKEPLLYPTAQPVPKQEVDHTTFNPSNTKDTVVPSLNTMDTIPVMVNRTIPNPWAITKLEPHAHVIAIISLRSPLAKQSAIRLKCNMNILLAFYPGNTETIIIGTASNTCIRAIVLVDKLNGAVLHSVVPFPGFMHFRRPESARNKGNIEKKQHNQQPR